jgi:hypothetical protein
MVEEPVVQRADPFDPEGGTVDLARPDGPEPAWSPDPLVPGPGLRGQLAGLGFVFRRGGLQLLPAAVLAALPAHFFVGRVDDTVVAAPALSDLAGVFGLLLLPLMGLAFFAVSALPQVILLAATVGLAVPTAAGSRPSLQTVAGSRPSLQTAVSSRPSLQTVAGSRPSLQTVVGWRRGLQTVAGSRPGLLTAVGTRPGLPTATGKRPSLRTASRLVADRLWVLWLWLAAFGVVVQALPLLLGADRLGAAVAVPLTVGLGLASVAALTVTGVLGCVVLVERGGGLRRAIHLMTRASTGLLAVGSLGVVLLPRLGEALAGQTGSTVALVVAVLGWSGAAIVTYAATRFAEDRSVTSRSLLAQMNGPDVA